MPNPSLPSRVSGLSDLAVIARGGYSTVYRAIQDSVGREVALKIDTRSLDQERDRRRFLREAGAAGRMSGHPNVVNVYDAGVTDDNYPYLVMELCTGGSYADRLRDNGPLPAAEVREVGEKIADALHAAHQAGILHRDVKPGNILINAYQIPGLADFGLAAIPDPTRELSVTMEALTPAYAPPEVFRLEKPTAGGDVYALAATLYALLSGRPPRWPESGMPSLATMIRLHEQPLPDLPGVPVELTEVLRQGMASDNADRFLSAAEFRDALAEVSLVEARPVRSKSAAAAAARASATRPAKPSRPSAYPLKAIATPAPYPVKPAAKQKPAAGPAYPVRPVTAPAPYPLDPAASAAAAAEPPMRAAAEPPINAAAELSTPDVAEPEPVSAPPAEPLNGRSVRESSSPVPPLAQREPGPRPPATGSAIERYRPTAGLETYEPRALFAAKAEPAADARVIEPAPEGWAVEPPMEGWDIEPASALAEPPPPAIVEPEPAESAPEPRHRWAIESESSLQSRRTGTPEPRVDADPEPADAPKPERDSSYVSPYVPPGEPPRRLARASGHNRRLPIGALALVAALVAVGLIAYGVTQGNDDDRQNARSEPFAESTPQINSTPDPVSTDLENLGKCPLEPSMIFVTVSCPIQSECFDNIIVGRDEVAAVKASCRRAHTWETYLIGDLPPDVKSNDFNELSQNAAIKSLCGEDGLRMVLDGEPTDGWTAKVLPPTDAEYAAGQDTFRCVASKGADKLDRPLFVRR